MAAVMSIANKKVPLLPAKSTSSDSSSGSDDCPPALSVVDGYSNSYGHAIRSRSDSVASSSVYSCRTSVMCVYHEQSESDSSEVSPYLSAISPRTLQSMEMQFSFTDSDVLPKLSRSWPAKCSYIVQELIITERAYVHSLTDVIKGYLTPFYSYILQMGGSPHFIKTVFGNIVKIHKIHMDLLESMQSSSSNPEEFAHAFLDCDFIIQYTTYCTNFSKGSDLLKITMTKESDIRDFIVKCQTDLKHSLPLNSELIKPVQRILKYPLLLEDLSRKFDWPDHPGSRLINQALEKMSSVALKINTSFHEPVKADKKNPRLIAQRRTKELQVLQKSRTLDSRHISSRLASNAQTCQALTLPQIYRSSLFPAPSPQSHSTKLNWMPPPTLNKGGTNPIDKGGAKPVDKSGAKPVDKGGAKPVDRGGAKPDQKSLHKLNDDRDGEEEKPDVNELKSFFEKLTKQSEDEMSQMSPSRRQSGGAIRVGVSCESDKDYVVTKSVHKEVIRRASVSSIHTIKKHKKCKPEPPTDAAVSSLPARSFFARFRTKKPPK